MQPDIQPVRILVVDDNHAIHDDFRKVLCPRGADEQLGALESLLFGGADTEATVPARRFHIDSAYQGEEAVNCIKERLNQGERYAVAFVDMRMPPGWDGLETIVRAWEVDPNIQVVICTAYSDHTWDDMRKQLGGRDSWLILKKPFDSVEVIQIAHALATKWQGQEELAAYTRELEERVKQRTEQLLKANETLKQTEKLSAIGQLAAGIAHEVNNPMGVILGFAQAMERRVPESDPLHIPASSIVREALRCKALVQELLTFSRRTPTTRTETVDMNALVQDTMLLLDLRARQQGVCVVSELGEALPQIRGNRMQLQQVIVNLSNNAMDAMDTGGTLTMRTRRDSDGQTQLEIADTGHGIPDEVKSRIFEPFFTTKEVGKGTGLGLSLVHEIVHQHRGSIAVESAPGVGTTMCVRLPEERRAL